jgi:hypothetical protein
MKEECQLGKNLNRAVSHRQFVSVKCTDKYVKQHAKGESRAHDRQALTGSVTLNLDHLLAAAAHRPHP